MNRDVEEQKAVFSRRAFLLSGIGAGAFTLLAGRLVDLQVRKSEDYKLLSEDNRFNLKVLLPSRGRLFDRYGRVLAENSRNFRILFTPEQAHDPEKTLNYLQNLLSLPEDKRQHIEKAFKKQRGLNPAILVENLSWEDFAKINLHIPHLPGMIPEVGEQRFYPHKHAFAHIIGYVARPRDDDIKKAPVLKQPGMLVGRSGLEEGLEKDLRGEAGRLKVEVNAYGRVVRKWDTPQSKPIAGDNIGLTLSSSLQTYIIERFGEESGAAAVMSVETGDILALVSTPSFDPNLFVTGISQKDYNVLREHERTPLFSKALSGTYAPASTFKMMTGLAALKTGLITPEDHFFCRGYTSLGERRFHCWRRGGHGQVSLKRALKESCDVYFYEVARKTGIKPITQMAETFGFGQAPDLPLKGVKAGLAPDPAWKYKRYNQAWTMGDSFNVSIGQGYVLASPLQLAVMGARLASGRLVSPRLLLSPAPAPNSFPALPISSEDLRLVQNAMKAVCEEPGGTAYKTGGLDLPGIGWAGKTGTAQVRAISRQERERGLTKQKDKPWKERDHALFVGYAPAEKPQLAVSVLVEHGGSGSGAAAPLARDILRFALLELYRTLSRHNPKGGA